METRPSGGGLPTTAADPWRRISPAHSWPDLVLPDPQRESLQAIAAGLAARGGDNGGGSTHASGPLVLFVGPVGTGKTMAARIIGAQLRRPILEVDTTALRAKDRSGLDQMIGRVFATAKAENAILYFEHADSVLSARGLPSTRQARPGALTASDLFDRAERHPGPVIFASTLRGKIDAAYRDRFRSVIEFPFPDREARGRIWRGLLPGDALLTHPDVEDLASSFQLPGAAIASCCSAAVALADEQGARVTLLHVAEAVQAEYRGRLASASTLAAVRALVARARAAQGDSAPARNLGAGRNGAPLAPGPTRDAMSPGPGSAREAAPRSTREEAPPAPHAARSAPLATDRAPVARRTGPGLLWVGALVATVAIGFGAARLLLGSQSAAPSRASAGPIQVSLPAGWRRAPRPIQGLGLSNELALEHLGAPRVLLTIGALPPGDPALLPGPVLAALHSSPPAQIAQVGPLTLYRYPSLVTRGSTAESVYATPTTIGTLVGVCASPATSARGPSECERVLSTVRLASGRVLGTASGVSYARALDAIITKLNATHTRVGAQLATAPTASSQASAASQLAAADSSAALAVNGLSPGLASAVNSKLAPALRASAAAYGALAHAAQRHDASAFAAARVSLASSQAAISAALSQLSALGYRIG